MFHLFQFHVRKNLLDNYTIIDANTFIDDRHFEKICEDKCQNPERTILLYPDVNKKYQAVYHHTRKYIKLDADTLEKAVTKLRKFFQ